MTVAGLLASTSSAELTEWLAYDQLQAEPPPKQNTDDENEAVLLAMASRGRKGQLKTGFDDLARRSTRAR
jgi:hypothetical protein